MAFHQANGTSPQTVLVTGASTGIGLCCAETLAKRGFAVFAGVRSENDASRLGAIHPNILPIHLDVTRPESIQRAAAEVATYLSGSLKGSTLNGLVNNAGIVVGGPLEFVPVTALRQQLEINVVGQVATAQAFLPMLREGKGRIINMGSVAGLTAIPFMAPYSASKFALEALTDAMRLELRQWGIHVAIIEPGSVATPIWEKSSKAAEAMARHQPPELFELYGNVLEHVKRATHESASRGIEPIHVVNAVLHALTAKRPKTRYPVGRHAHLRHWFGWLPDGIKDWLIASRLGLG